MFVDRKVLERIATALERLALAQEVLLRQRGLSLSYDPELGEGEILYTDPDKLAEMEALRDKYMQEVGVFRDVPPGPLAPSGREWTPEDVEILRKQTELTTLEELLRGEGAIGGSSESVWSVGPEGAESDAGPPPRAGYEQTPPAGDVQGSDSGEE